VTSSGRGGVQDGLADLALITTLALLWFRIPFRGNPLLLLLASVLYIVTALGIGLVISTISRTQQEAFMAVFLIFLPTILLSGFMFPVTSMPEVFRWLTLINPMRHYLEIVRGIFGLLGAKAPRSSCVRRRYQFWRHTSFMLGAPH
jgi:ABC-2 type transport system permease protein